MTADSFNDSANPIDPNSLLEGRCFDSIHPFIGDDGLHGHETAETRGVGYVSFPNLVIRQEGTYRIRATLIKVQSATNETLLHLLVVQVFKSLTVTPSQSSEMLL